MAEDNFGQDELVEILATSTAVAAPARKSFKDVMYMKDFAPDMTNYVPEVPEIPGNFRNSRNFGPESS